MSTRISRREFLARSVRAAALVGAASALPVELAAAAEPRIPNVVFVFADQLRYSSVGLSGNRQVRTPNIDRLALEGVSFSNAVSGYPVCTPYRAMLMTGRYCQSVGVPRNDVPLPDMRDSFANVLKRSGRETGYIGKWHLEANRKPFVPKHRRQGFDYWVTANCNHNYFDTPTCFGDSEEPRPLQGYQPDAETDLAIDYIKQHADTPFFLCMSWGPPHDPYIAPPQWMKMYDAQTIEQPPNTEGDYRARIARYYAAATDLDHNIGRLMKTLAEAGIGDDTIFVFSSDHGDMLGSHDASGAARKQRPWDESVHIPFVVRYPRAIPRGVLCDTPINVVDFMPTVLGLAGVPVPASVEGTDLSTFARGLQTGGPDSVLLQNLVPSGEAAGKFNAWRGVRTRRHTYARFRDKGWVLYDNADDPHQLNNLIDRPEARRLQSEMEGLLLDWLKKTGDDFAPAEFWRARAETARSR